MTLLSAAIILTFTMIEFFDYRRVNVDTSIVVDRSRGEKLTVRMNVTFPRVPCYREYSSFVFFITEDSRIPFKTVNLGCPRAMVIHQDILAHAKLLC